MTKRSNGCISQSRKPLTVIVGLLLGFVLAIEPQARAQTFTILYSFSGGSDGGFPYGALLQDAAGNLYGTTRSGGAFDAGTVFKIDAAGNETVLHSFGGSGDGSYPDCALLRDSAGDLYGTTPQGGAHFAGTVFKIDANGNETVLYSFDGFPDGSEPHAALIRDSAGNLYGTTKRGGTHDLGTIFRVSPAGVETVLHSFGGTPDGDGPLYGALVPDGKGNLYGTTIKGGTNNYGAVFRWSASGGETVVHSFKGGNDGYQPFSTLLQVSGNFYGTTFGQFQIWRGTIFKIAPTGQSKTLYKFSGDTDGKWPAGGLVRDPAGNFYGTTSTGGTLDRGTIFELSRAGVETILYDFAQNGDGIAPNAALIRDSAGNLYGTTVQGGAFSSGIVFRFTP